MNGGELELVDGRAGGRAIDRSALIQVGVGRRGAAARRRVLILSSRLILVGFISTVSLSQSVSQSLSER